jgi:hypothetical protein
LIKILKAEIEDFLNALEVQEANIHNIPVQDYNRKIKNTSKKEKIAGRPLSPKSKSFFLSVKKCVV